jgi:protein-S-isoprenylcysteine O-methyltransferase Ste14
MHKQIFPSSFTLGATGLILTAAGIFFAIWARLMLGTNWSGRITLKEDHELITTGPYAVTRNPIYTGVLLAVTGKAFIKGDMQYIIMLVILFIALLIKIHYEEKLLSSHFGNAYSEYLRNTKKLIPFIF